MLSEYQSKIIDFCEYCGAYLYDCADWDGPKWETGECSGPNHRAANYSEPENIESEIDEIIKNINQTTKTINRVTNKLQRYFKIVEDAETIKCLPK